MASAVAAKGVPLPVLLKELLASPSASGKTAASTRRLFLSKLFSDDSSEDSSSSDEDAAADRRRERDLSITRLFSGDVQDLFDERLLLALTGNVGVASRTGSSPRGWWVSKEDGDAVQLKVAMPGLGKEHVKMRVEKDTLVIKGVGDGNKAASDGDKGKGEGDKGASDGDKGKGDGDKGASDGDKGKGDGDNGASDGDKGKGDDDDDKGSARYSYRIVLSSQAFKMDQIKAEMKNGLLSLTVPKIKDEERKDVFEIKIE